MDKWSLHINTDEYWSAYERRPSTSRTISVTELSIAICIGQNNFERQSRPQALIDQIVRCSGSVTL